MESADPTAATAVPAVDAQRAKRFAWWGTVFGFVALVAAFWFAEPAQVYAQLQGVDLRWFWASFALSVVQMGALGLRWRRVAALFGIDVSWARATRECALSMSLNALLPGAGWGDGVRALRQLNARSSLGATLQAVAVDRVSSQLGLWLVVFAGLPWSWQVVHASQVLPSGSRVAWWLLAAGCVLGVCWALVRASALGRKLLALSAVVLRRAGHALFTFRGASGHLPLSIGVVVLLLVQFDFAARAIAIELPASQVLGLVPLVMVAASLPSTFGGLGLREVVSALLFAGAGVGSSAGVAVGVVFGVFALVSSLPALVLIWFNTHDA